MSYRLGDGAGNWQVLYRWAAHDNYIPNAWYSLVLVKQGSNYRLYVNGAPDGSLTFTESFARGQSPIGGDQDLALANLHPADNSPADWRIEIGEMTSYSAAWKRGSTWPQPPNPIPIA